MKTKYLLILIILSFSCKSKNEGLFRFDPRSLEENEITLSQIADEITYVQLDNSFPMGLIYDNIIFINSSIYLSSKDNGILIFDRKGKLVRKIGSFGRGPGEYISCVYIAVDDNKGTIYVLDRRNIKVYSKAGNFLRSFSLSKVGGLPEEIGFFNSNLFIPYEIQQEDSKFEWTVLDTLGNIIKSKENSGMPFYCDWGLKGKTYKFEDRLFYWNPFNDTVFSILPDLSYKASFIINPGEHRIPRSTFSFEQHDKYLELKQVFETNRFLVIRYHYLKPALVLIDKDTYGSFLTYLEGPDSGFLAWKLTGGIVNDLDGGLRFLPNDYFTENGHEYMYGLINPYQIKEHIKSDDFKNSVPKYPEKKQDFQTLANSLDETDNPVLMIVRLKR